jgi:hypothetical protein
VSGSFLPRMRFTSPTQMSESSSAMVEVWCWAFRWRIPPATSRAPRTGSAASGTLCGRLRTSIYLRLLLA